MLSSLSTRKNKQFLLQANAKHLNVLLGSNPKNFGSKVLAQTNQFQKGAKSKTLELAVTLQSIDLLCTLC